MSSGLALGYVFGLGMVAVFNPCGFAMLPAWVAYFVAADGAETSTAFRGVLRALTVGAALTAGFVTVFLVVGIAIQLTASSLVARLPWVSIALGVGMVLLAISLFRGRELNVPNPLARQGPQSQAHREVFLFGVSYALVSLTCTIPLFLGAVTTSLTSGSLAVGVLHFVAYASGMGLILTVLTLAVSLARESVVRHMRRVTPYMNRVAAVLLGVAGAYVAYYGWYSLRVYSGNFNGGGPAEIAYDLSGRTSTWIASVGSIRIGIAALAVISSALLVSFSHQGRRAAARADDAAQSSDPQDGAMVSGSSV